MTANSNTLDSVQDQKLKVELKSKSLWGDAWYRLKKDKIAMACIFTVVAYSIVAVLSYLGVIASDWSQQVGASYGEPTWNNWFGTDIFGRSVMAKVIKGTEVALSVGLVSSLIAIPIGLVLGAVAGYFGGWVDDFVVWLYTTFSSIPYIMLIMSFSLILGKGLTSIYIALGLTSWTGLCRLIRGEVMKHKNREYVQAASALGAGHVRKLFLHIVPNITHIVIIRTSLQFQVAIKSEVILSYLGLGVSGVPSWGTMIDDAKVELARGFWWQFIGATIAMFFIVLAFNILGDALRDALDPKLKGK